MYEAITMNGNSMVALVQEIFGDGIMSVSAV
jgi:cyanate lyase